MAYKKIKEKVLVEPIIKPLTAKEIEEATKERISLINKEFKEGFELIQKYPKSVTFFGSTRLDENNKYYQKARSLAGKLSGYGYTIITGGGSGIMEAGNRGAFEANGNSIGLNIKLPREQEKNKYLTDSHDFHYFFSRKVALAFSAEAYVAFPGGYGTLDEFMEIAMLIQTRKIMPVPIILVGKEFWEPFDKFLKEIVFEKYKAVDEKDLSIYKISDDEEEIVKIILREPVANGVEFHKE